MGVEFFGFYSLRSTIFVRDYVNWLIIVTFGISNDCYTCF